MIRYNSHILKKKKKSKSFNLKRTLIEMIFNGLKPNQSKMGHLQKTNNRLPRALESPGQCRGALAHGDVGTTH